MRTRGFQRTGLTASEYLPEREDHLVVVEGAAYKPRYRPVQANCAMAKSVLSTLPVYL
jgi:hypothetical protein